MLFPSQTLDSNADETTVIALADSAAEEPLPIALGIYAAADRLVLQTPITPNPRSLRIGDPSLRLLPLLGDPSRGSFARPGLKGYRTVPNNTDIGHDWSARFTLPAAPVIQGNVLTISAEDRAAGLGLTTEIESLIGGSLRIRHTVTNLTVGTYALESLEVRIPLADNQTEIMDFTGRHENERQPQRHGVADGTWLREGRRGKPSFEGSMIIAGTAGFDFDSGSVVAVQPAWSGNSVLAVDRTCEDAAAICAGELLLPGEIMLERGERYSTPWIMITASEHGLDGVAHSLHAWQRSLPAHPDVQPITLNVWEAVYMDHDFNTLSEIARRAAAIGVERYVLDDGWFHDRRDDHAGLGDWWVDPQVWPDGLGPLIGLVHNLGMQFGLWFEPEMVNPDSDLFREHPDWVMQTGGRLPIQQRNQYVLDLTNPDAFNHVLNAMSRVFEEYAIDYVKWDHNRDLADAGSAARGGAPAVHEQTLAFHRLLDTLHERFPHVQWESCASGGGRIDMGVVEHVSRVWTSDMTDALSRQRIQRWTVQTMAPEYMGAHISAPTSHQSHRTYSLAFRAATAVFYGFGIEWNILQASDDDMRELKTWVIWYKSNRELLHSGRVVRLDIADPAVYGYGVIARDRSQAVIAHAQIEESSSNRGIWLRVPGLQREAEYALSWTGPVPAEAALETLDSSGPIGANGTISGEMLERVGVWIPRCRPETIRLIAVKRV